VKVPSHFRLSLQWKKNRAVEKPQHGEHDVETIESAFDADGHSPRILSRTPRISAACPGATLRYPPDAIPKMLDFLPSDETDLEFANIA